MTARKSFIKTQDVVAMYTIQHLSSCEIQKLIGMSRSSIMKRLKSAGISTKQGEWINVTCDFCGKQYQLVRSRWRNTERHYCSNECYYASLYNSAYYQSRQGQRIARAIVNQYFKLEPEHIVHHKDGDTRHNDLVNLSVYASHSDHLKATHHNNYKVMPIWDGAINLHPI